MRYYKVNDEEFIQNGRSVIRVGRVLVFPSPISEGRTVRVFEVLQTVRENPKNTIPRGALLAISFPDEHVNDDEYVWYKNGWEECPVPYQITDRKANLNAMNKRN